MSATSRMGRIIRTIASGGWASGDLEISEEWHARAVELAVLVDAGKGAEPEARSVAADLLDMMREVGEAPPNSEEATSRPEG